MWYPYSHRIVNIPNLSVPEQYLRFSAALPVFGIKYNDNAFIAAITKGEESAGIMAFPSGQVVNLNRIHFEIYPRNIFNVEVENITVAGSSLGRIVQRIDRAVIREDREIKYFMLSGGDASYSGMARAYREYLIDAGKLVSGIEPGDELPLSLRVLMGTSERQMVFDRYHTMTSFRNLIDIFERLRLNDVTNVNTVLLSWTRNGYSPPRNWPPARQLCGAGGLRELDGYLESNAGFSVFLETNFVYAIRANRGFSTMRDIVYNGTNIPVSISFYGRSGSTEMFILNPASARSMNDSFMHRMRAYNNINIAYRSIGQTVYNDYNRRARFTKAETVGVWRGMLEDSAERMNGVAARGMNQYTFETVSYLYEVPIRAFGLNITDDHVPFAQMVISGMIPYSSEPGNLSYDLNRQVLRWIEYGAAPSFTITYNDPIILRNTSYNWLFTSAFDDWEERILGIYNEMRTNLADVYGRQMVSHEILMRDVVRIEYENGVSIYINYTDREVAAGNVIIPPVGYVVVN
jgi:hypothetical protein